MAAWKYFVGDFETTYVKETDEALVWLSAIVDLKEDAAVQIFRNIKDTLDFIASQGNSYVYYHNLKFDGSYILCYLKSHSEFIEEFEEDSSIEQSYNTYSYIINDMGYWYCIKLNYYGTKINFFDSYKILPFSVETIGKSFATNQKKLIGTVDYTLYRDETTPVTGTELDYIRNDVLVVREALAPIVLSGRPKMTIGSYCLSEFKKTVKTFNCLKTGGLTSYEEIYPDLHSIVLSDHAYSNSDIWNVSLFADEYIRKSYHGGFCYLVEGKENKVFHDGVVLDVNSLYPSMMHSDSGNYFPVGTPAYIQAKDGQNEVYYDESKYKLAIGKTYYFVRFKCRFRLKQGMLPTVQIKGNRLYKANEWLKTSDFRINGEYRDHTYDAAGRLVKAEPELTMTQTDFELFLSHYDVYELKIIDYVVFPSLIGLFDDYINHYREQKENSTGAKRTLAKLYLNNLYGKMATSPQNITKRTVLNDGVLEYYDIQLTDKTAGHIPTGSAITSYARNFTIQAAQANFYGVNHRGFIYADTDSIHCDLPIDDIAGVKLHATEFNHWKYESSFDNAIFVRQKTYIEEQNGDYDIKCAGMGKEVKDSLNELLKTGTMSLTDFKVGLRAEGKKVSHRAKGGIAITTTTFELR